MSRSVSSGRCSTVLTVSPPSRFEMDTSDAELAREWISTNYVEHSLKVSGSREGFRMRVRSASTNLFRIDEALHTMTVHAHLEPHRNLQVNQVRAGAYRLAGPKASIRQRPGDVAMMDPARPGRLAWESLATRVVVLDTRAAAVVAADLSGLPADRIRFSLSEPVDTAHARYWCATVDHVERIALSTTPTAPLVRAEAFRALATAAVVSFPNTALEALLNPVGAPTGLSGPATVRRAVEFIEAHAHEDIGLADIADAARIGSRGLQAAFRRHRGQSPTAYLRQVRLEGAHRELRDADPSRGDTVSAIAARWGFPHPGRFAVEYARTYGCSPSRTLRD